MTLDKPICFLDIESTGTDPSKDRIVEISILKMVSLDEHYEVKSTRINPGIPIPAESSAVHHITDADVKDCPAFSRVAKGILSYLEESDIAGFASNSFDVPMLYSEFNRCGIVWDYSSVNFIDVGNIYKRQNERTLSAAYKHYCGRELTDAHSSEADVIATMEVFKAQSTSLPDSVEEIALYSNFDRPVVDLGGCFSRDAEGDYVFAFGKNKGRKCKSEAGYLQWMLKQDFLPDAIKICKLLTNDNPRNILPKPHY